MSEQGCKNTDREIWRGPDEGGGDFYADSLHITEGRALGINCGGHVIVKPIREWHRLAVSPPAHQENSPRSAGDASTEKGDMTDQAPELLPTDRLRIARVLYECEKRRATHTDAVVKSAFPRASDALLMEPWEECKDTFLSDADAVLAVLPHQPDAACYLERFKVREILIGQPDENLEITEAVLAEIDALPFFSEGDLLTRPTPAERPAPQVREALEARLADLREANELARDSSWDRSAEILRNDREIRFLLDLKAMLALTPVVAREPVGWHLASMNDGLFIINAAPRPSNDDVWPDRPDGPTIVLNVTELPEAKAIKIVGVLNSLTSPPPASAVREALEFEFEKWSTDERTSYPDSEVLDSLDRIRALIKGTGPQAS